MDSWMMCCFSWRLVKRKEGISIRTSAVVSWSAEGTGLCRVHAVA